MYLAAASCLRCEMDFKKRKVMNILIAADNTANAMNIIQCVVRLCSSICVFVLRHQCLTSLLHLQSLRFLLRQGAFKLLVTVP